MIFIGMVVNASNYMEAILIPAIIKDFGVEIDQAGIIATAYLIGFGVSTIFAGPLADRYGKIEIIIIAALLFAITIFLSSLTNEIKSLIFFRTLSGIFIASIFPVSNALISDIFPAKERQWALGVFQSVSMIGQFLGIVVIGILIMFLSWPIGYIILALGAFASTLLLLPIKKNLVCSKNKDQRFIENYKNILIVSRNRQTYLVILVQGGLILGLLSYLGAYIKSVVGLDFYIAGLIISGFGITNFLFSNSANKMAMKMGQKKATVAGLAFGLIANALLLLLGEYLPVLVIAPIFVGFTFIFSHCTLLSIASEFSPKARSSSLSLVAGCFTAGGGIGVNIGGFVIKHFGYQSLFLLYSLTFMILIFLVLRYLKLPYLDQINSCD